MIATQSKILCAGLIVTVALTHQSWAANECDAYKERAAYYQKLRNMGGNADEMNYWTAKGHELDEEIYLCQRDTAINPVVQVTTNNTPTQIATDTPAATKAAKRLHVPLRSSISDDTRLQGLIQTCNYWIKLSNENAAQDNISFRDIACSAVDKYQDAPRTSSDRSVSDNQRVPVNQSVPSNQNKPSTTAAVKKLKDCIKPNNHIDHEVNECVKGNIKPIWRK